MKTPRSPENTPTVEPRDERCTAVALGILFVGVLLVGSSVRPLPPPPSTDAGLCLEPIPTSLPTTDAHSPRTSPEAAPPLGRTPSIDPPRSAERV